MALAEKKIAPVDVATIALWRAAENGDVDELAELLPRVRDIDACNEHGVTALMRAAQDGHAKMVRALLEHGADANIKRNDKFTALALAAFFGHTEVVRTLMEHGADLQASTRSGTSPQMWATARTFNEVVDQLENRVARPPVVRSVDSVVRETAAGSSSVQEPLVVRKAPLAVAAAPSVVRTLKDPPEIWDLVHEAPRNFDAKTAFLTRVKSDKTGFAFRVATAVVFMGMCVVSVLVLRGVQARSEGANEPQPITSQPSKTEQPATAPHAATTDALAAPQTNVEPAGPTVTDNNKPGVGTSTVPTPTVATPAVVNPTFVTPSFARPTVGTRRFNSASRAVVSSQRAERDASVVTATETPQPVAAPAEKPAAPVRVEPSAKSKANVPLSPQLITPAKGSSAKTKVIQWP